MDFNQLNIRTKTDMVTFLRDLDECQSQEQAKVKISNDQYLALMRSAQDAHLSFEEVKRDIKVYANTLKDIVIYISFDPSQKFIETILDIFHDYSGYLFEFRVEPNLLGGAKLSLNGKLYDESVSSRLMYVLQSNK